MVETSTLFYLLDSRTSPEYSVESFDFSEYQDVIGILGEPEKVNEETLLPIKDFIKSLTIE